ncbi:PEP-CTERM sorting domain-containing protein [Pseudoduganella albidiflava]|nr:PEP-CTERM sorting domain-containing protein [Pseudoduganella albidiflava]GGY38255.1 hypothetical protein GCM10007387_20300 [Pseudoduganella albidiflava]
MLKLILSAGLLAASAVTAQAAETEYAFQWTGFAELSPMDELIAWYPNITYSGTFRGEDIDHDSVIRLDEISSLRMTDYHPDFVVGCPAAGPSVVGPSDCMLTSFTYELGGDLAFSAAYQISDRGDSYHWFGFSPPYGMSWEPAHHGDGYEYRITDDTIFQIAAVPEPASWIMLLSGLGLVVATIRKHGRSQGR